MSNVTYLRPRHPDTLAEHVTETIRSRIVGGEFELGEPLSETHLAIGLGVNRTSVREALQRLEPQGLVEIGALGGTFVFDMTAQAVRDLSELREVLEVAAARVAIRRRANALANALDEAVNGMREALRNADVRQYRKIDAGYHKAIIDHAGNAYLRAAYDAIDFRIQALRNRLSLDPVLNKTSFRQHRQFAVLVRAGEIYRASTCLSDHIRSVTANYLCVAGLDEP